MFVADKEKRSVFKYLNERRELNLRSTMKVCNTNIINFKLMNDHMSICSMDNSRSFEALYFLSLFRYTFFIQMQKKYNFFYFFTLKL